MTLAQQITSMVLSLRKKEKIIVRQPLQCISIPYTDNVQKERIESMKQLILDEVNVKDVVFGQDVTDLADKTLYVITPLVGKRLGRFMKDILKASKTGEWQANPDGTLAIAGQTLLPEEFELRLVLKEGNAGQALPDNTAVVVLDVELRPELEREGIARDFVRIVQQKRKENGFDVSDRITVVYSSDNATVLEALKENKDYISEQVLAVGFEEQSLVDGDTEEVGDASVTFKIQKV